jgi:hypothetical protein
LIEHFSPASQPDRPRQRRHPTLARRDRRRLAPTAESGLLTPALFFVSGHVPPLLCNFEKLLLDHGIDCLLGELFGPRWPWPCTRRPRMSGRPPPCCAHGERSRRRVVPPTEVGTNGWLCCCRRSTVSAACPPRTPIHSVVAIATALVLALFVIAMVWPERLPWFPHG